MKLVKKEKRIKILLRIDEGMDDEIAVFADIFDRTKSDMIRCLLTMALDVLIQEEVYRKQRKSLKKENI